MTTTDAIRELAKEMHYLADEMRIKREREDAAKKAMEEMAMDALRSIGDKRIPPSERRLKA